MDAERTRFRMEHRTKSRITAEVSGHASTQKAIGPTKDGSGWSGLGFGVAAGYRINFFSKLGIRTRLGFSYSEVTLKDVSPSRATNASESVGFRQVFVEAAPVVGPLGRFYLAPLVYGANVGFHKSEAVVGKTSYDLTRTPSWRAGAGLELGFLAGSKEQIALNLRGKVAFEELFPFMFELTFGWHFFPG